VKRLALAAGIVLIGGIGAWQGVEALQETNTETPALPLGKSGDASDAAPAKAGSTSTATPGVDQLSRAETPMAQRVAVLGLLNKRNGLERDLTMKPGQALRVGDVVVRLRACETSAPWEAEPLTGAFVQLDVEARDSRWRRVFSGWLYKESPSLNVVEHPIYDVWPKSCAMTHPDIGPDTVMASAVGAGAPAAPRSSAKKSPDKDGSPSAAKPAEAAAPPPSASSNSAR
jgi:hypothetical protein